jgi:hypothetical protein
MAQAVTRHTTENSNMAQAVTPHWLQAVV